VEVREEIPLHFLKQQLEAEEEEVTLTMLEQMVALVAENLEMEIIPEYQHLGFMD
jgi:hypothetical protein